MSSASKKLFSPTKLCDKSEAISFSLRFSISFMGRDSTENKQKSTSRSSAPALCFSQSNQSPVFRLPNFLTEQRKHKDELHRVATLKLALDVAILGTVYPLRRLAAQARGYPYLRKTH